MKSIIVSLLNGVNDYLANWNRDDNSDMKDIDIDGDDSNGGIDDEENYYDGENEDNDENDGDEDNDGDDVPTKKKHEKKSQERPQLIDSQHVLSPSPHPLPL